MDGVSVVGGFRLFLWSLSSSNFMDDIKFELFFGFRFDDDGISYYAAFQFLFMEIALDYCLLFGGDGVCFVSDSLQVTFLCLLKLVTASLLEVILDVA